MTYNSFLQDLDKIFTRFKQSVIEFLPNLLAAAVIFLLGLFVARLLQTFAHRAIRNVGRIIPNRRIRSQVQPEKMERPARLIANVLYWIIIFFFLTASTETLGLPIVTTWLSGIASYLPRILAALLIGAAGVIGGVLVRDVIATTAVSAGVTYGATLGKLAQYTLILITVLVAVEQLGLNITLLTNVIIIFLSTLVIGAVLSFALGAKTSVSNILASYYLQKVYSIGQTVKIGDLEGAIIQISPIAVILDTPQGQVYVPAKKFNEMTSTLVRK